MAESWLFMSYLAQPAHFAWEDIKTQRQRLLNVPDIVQQAPQPPEMIPSIALRPATLEGQEEIAYFRAKIENVTKLLEKKSKVRLINAEITSNAIATNFPSAFLVHFRYHQLRNRVRCRRDDTLFKVIRDDLLLHIQPTDLSVSWVPLSAEDYVVKLGRCNEYIFDTNVPLSSIQYVRDCITKSQVIEFELVEYEPLKSKAANRFNSLPTSEQAHQSFCSIKADKALGLATRLDYCYNIADVTKKFELKICRVENFSKQALYATNKFFRNDIEGEGINLFVIAGLYYGGELIAPPIYTQPVRGRPVWNEWMQCESVRMCDIPRETRICFSFYACLGEQSGTLAKFQQLLRGGYTEFVPLGWVNYNLVDFTGVVATGRRKIHMWPPTSTAQNPFGTCVSNLDPKSLALVIEFDSTSPRPVIFVDDIPEPFVMEKEKIEEEEEEPEKEKEEEAEVSKLLGKLDMEEIEDKEPDPQERKQLEAICKRDALCCMNSKEKKLVWAYRYYLMRQYPQALSKVLLAVAWNMRSCVEEAHKLLRRWEPIPHIYALELLDVRFPDTKVRQFAVSCLRDLSDRELVEFLPQLVQVLKSEPYHYSALSEFLLLRSISSIVVGHPFFWHLTSEIHLADIAVRFKLMLEGLLQGWGDDEVIQEFANQLKIVESVANVAKSIKEGPYNKEEKQRALRQYLRKLDLPSSFQLPNNPKFEAINLILDKCRVMDSMTQPLWLVFENAERSLTQIIFKAGDDLRTDILVLQMMRIMDGLWKSEGLDLHMQPYRAVCTGKEVGIIEVIANSQTTAAIQQTYGGGGAVSAFSTTAIRDWLRDCNPTEKAHEDAIKNFTLSCAGYCVATYILGIGDRHNDNIMCSYSGNMFHIDFGYFLGKRVTFVGIPRETTPFVLTPEFAEAMGGEGSANFKQFVHHCCKAYNILRKHGHLFITLFVMMLSSGIEQLHDFEDLYYLRDALSLELTETQAAAKFTNLIYQSLHNQMTRVNNMVHIHFHPKNK
ncbi:Phosphatidylinositol 4,5-bisphosphate 3-kinase catalytic subunit gamma isoform [Balamuthia mandrillaris]